jgi:hypothetical protein
MQVDSKLFLIPIYNIHKVAFGTNSYLGSFDNELLAASVSTKVRWVLNNRSSSSSSAITPPPQRNTSLVTTTAMFDEVISNGKVKCHANIDIRQAPDNLSLMLKKSGNVVSDNDTSIYQGVYRNGSSWRVSLSQSPEIYLFFSNVLFLQKHTTYFSHTYTI